MHNPNSRLEAFCDGVFAIALTLLIIEIKVPPLHEIHSIAELWKAFAHQWPSWFAFLVSFTTILISWVNHSHAFKLIDKSSPKFTYANGLLLLSITVLPFTTAAVGEYIHTDFAQPAVTVYCAVSLLNNIAWVLLVNTSLKPVPLYKKTVNLDKIRQTQRYNIMGFFLYLAMFILSFWFPVTAFCIMAATFVLWLILGISLNEKPDEELIK